MSNISGNILDRNDNPCQRAVYAISRPTDGSQPVVLDWTLSSSETGYFELSVPASTEVSVIVISEDDDNPVLNDKIKRVISN